MWETLIRLVAPAFALGALGWLAREPLGDALRVLKDGFAGAGAAGAASAGAALALGLGLAAWYLSLLVCHRLGARAALYLLVRRDLDGVAPGDGGSEEGPAKSLSDLGIELVQRIRDEEEE